MRSGNSEKIIVAVICCFSIISYLFIRNYENVNVISVKRTACAFENLSPDCFDSSSVWNKGLAYFDSALSVNNDTLLVVKNLLWKHWDLKFSGQKEASQPSSIFPRQVLFSRRYGCMGLVWLVLMLKEDRKIPIEPVLLPNHIFFRFKGINVEPNREGISYTDEEYRQKYASGSWSGFEFIGLSEKQFLGLVAFNIGNSYLYSAPKTALSWYRIASDFFPAFPGIAVNRKIAFEQSEDNL